MKANSLVKLYSEIEGKDILGDARNSRGLVVYKWKEFTETNRNSFRGQLNPLVMNVKGNWRTSSIQLGSLWLSLMIAINILVIYLKFLSVVSTACVVVVIAFLFKLLAAILFECREPSLQNRLCLLRASLKSKLTVTVGHCLTANRHHSYVNAGTVCTEDLLFYTIV